MRIIVTGATGNVGTSVVRALRDDESVSHVVGLARRPPKEPEFLGIEWRQVDVAVDDLVPHFQHADAVIHLAWQLQPERRRRLLHEVNVVGSGRVFDAVARAEVQALLYASSFGAYSPASSSEPVDETWPTEGIATSLYSQQKAYVERLLDRFEFVHPLVRVVRLRPALTYKGQAASEIQRLFLGRLLPALYAPLARLSIIPDVSGLATQVVHTDDVAEAYRLALLGSVTGPYNIAGEEAVDATSVARWFGLRALPLPPRLSRSLAGLGWHLGVQPSEPGWLDLVLQSPLLETHHARKELGWKPSRSSSAVVKEFAGALATGGGLPTPPLRPGRGLSTTKKSQAEMEGAPST